MDLHPSLADPRFPVDESDRLLLERVRPSDWATPPPRARYDLVVIGAGTGGLVTAAIAAALGASVALVERDRMGGDCLNTGCVPSKAMIHAASERARARRAQRELGAPDAVGEADFAAAMRRMRELRAQIATHDSAARFRDLGVDVFLGEGRFTAADRVEVHGHSLRFRRAVIATGARPFVPPIPGLPELDFLTSESVFSLVEAPRSLAIIGGGAIGCELAQAFARFGTSVTLLETRDRILFDEDPEAAAIVHVALERDGVRVLTGTRIREAERGAAKNVELRYAAPGGEGIVAADEVLLAAGRTPNVEALDLGTAGVERAEHGVKVDDRLRTSNPRIFAVGDVASGIRFTHLADAHARMVVRNALFPGRSRHTRLVVPRVTYTDPELAHVRMAAPGPEAATEQVTVHFADLDRARLDGETEGFLRVHLRPGSDSIVAATVVGPRAGEIISHLTTAMTRGIGLGRLGETIFPYPTYSEIIRRAADQRRRESLTPRVQRGLGLFLRLTRRL